MFEAYSFKVADSINVNKVTDTSEIFGCLNSKCAAKFKIKAINSAKATHFSRLSSTPHSNGCPYILGNDLYVNSGSIIKYSIEDIFNNAEKPTILSKTSAEDSSSGIQKKRTYIKTPKQLLIFCVSNSIEAKYINDLTVDDILLDSRNLQKNARFKGIEGKRLLIGTTYKFILNNDIYEILFNISTRTKMDKGISLHAKIIVSAEQGSEIVKYILDTFDNKFCGHSLAVLGDWKKINDYNVVYKVQDNRHVIYKFTNDIKNKLDDNA